MGAEEHGCLIAAGVVDHRVAAREDYLQVQTAAVGRFVLAAVRRDLEDPGLLAKYVDELVTAGAVRVDAVRCFDHRGGFIRRTRRAGFRRALLHNVVPLEECRYRLVRLQGELQRRHVHRAGVAGGLFDPEAAEAVPGLRLGTHLHLRGAQVLVVSLVPWDELRDGAHLKVRRSVGFVNVQRAPVTAGKHGRGEGVGERLILGGQHRVTSELDLHGILRSLFRLGTLRAGDNPPLELEPRQALFGIRIRSPKLSLIPESTARSLDDQREGV